MLDLSAYRDFETAAAAALDFLHDRLGFDLWMITRQEADDWIILQTAGEGYGVQGGEVYRWADSFCSRMVDAQGPRIAPRSNDVLAYAAAPIGRQFTIGAYIGAPLTRHDGELFGTLCAIHPTPQSEALEAERPLVELIARMLSTILSAELDALEQLRRAERAEALADTDALTGAYNRRGWDTALEIEENRCCRYGAPACVFVIDMDDLKAINDNQGHQAGDELLIRLATALKSVSRDMDVVARVGGDEFVILGVECNKEGAEVLRQRVVEAIDQAGVRATIGMAQRAPEGGLAAAWLAADRDMYRCKGACVRNRGRSA